MVVAASAQMEKIERFFIVALLVMGKLCKVNAWPWSV